MSNKFRSSLCFNYILGLGIVLMAYLPILILGENALFIVHDQMDDKVMTYILHARHPFSQFYYELFNGTNEFTMPTPAPAFTVLYMLMPSSSAFITSHVIIAALAFTGMYMSLCELVGKMWVAVVSAVLFSILPFYAVYGLSIMGQPLLLYFVISIIRNKGGRIKYYVAIMFLAVSSSLVTVGYADIIILTLFSLFLYIKKHKSAGRVLAADALLILTYTFMNWNLVMGYWGVTDGFISHRIERIPDARDFGKAFVNMWINGQYHAVSLHKYVLHTAVFVALISAAMLKKQAVDKKSRQALALLLYTLFAAFFYALWHSEAITKLRTYTGGYWYRFSSTDFTGFTHVSGICC